MATETEVKTEVEVESRITVDYRPGRWGRVFHLFDKDNREIALQQKEAVKMARAILKIVKEQP